MDRLHEVSSSLDFDMFRAQQSFNAIKCTVRSDMRRYLEPGFYRENLAHGTEHDQASPSHRGIGALEYRPMGWPEGSVKRQIAPERPDRLNGNPGTTLAPSSIALLHDAWMSATCT